MPHWYWINDTTTVTIFGAGCWRLLVGSEPSHKRGSLAARREGHRHAAGRIREREALARARHGRQLRRTFRAQQGRGGLVPLQAGRFDRLDPPSHKAQVGGNPPRTHRGDYGAAAVDGSSIWIASEYIATACDYTHWAARRSRAVPGHSASAVTCVARSATGRRRSASARRSHVPDLSKGAGVFAGPLAFGSARSGPR